MIKRNIPKKLIPVENLIEERIGDFKGIDVNSPPTNLNNIYDSVNLDLDLDKGLTLRKPLFFDKSIVSDNISTYGYIFDDSLLTITNNGMLYVGNAVIELRNDKGETVYPVSMRIPDATKVSFINTNTSTIILGLAFNLNYDYLKHYAKKYNLDSGDYIKNRPVRITKDGSSYKAEVMQIETATLYTEEDSTVRAPFNLMDDYTFSFRDNYKAGYAYCNGVFMYAAKSGSINTNDTVEVLTESDKYEIVDSLISEEANRPYILKAFVTNTTFPIQGYKLYCTWEKTYDNVTWHNVEEFLNSSVATDGIVLDVTDNTKSYESKDTSYKYTRKVTYVPFLNENNSQQDPIISRPDVLILNNIDSATYRFTIRSVADNIDTGTVERIAHSLTVTNASNLPFPKYNGRDVITVDSANVTIKLKLSYTFKGDLTTPNDKAASFRLAIRSVFTNDGSSTSFKNSLGTLLTDTVLDDITHPTSLVATFKSVYDSATNTTSLTFTDDTPIVYEIPVNINSNWLTQLLCFNVTLVMIDNGEVTTLSVQQYEAIIGKDLSGQTPTSNPEFKYGVSTTVNNVSTSLLFTSGRGQEHPDCYKIDTPYVWGPQLTPVEYVDDINNPNTIGISLDLSLVEVQVKQNIPIEMLSNLVHSSSVPKVYLFNNYKYYLQNINVSFNLKITSVVHLSYAAYAFGIEAYRFNSTIRITVKNITMSLYDYLSLKTNINPLVNSFKTNVNNTNYDFVFDFNYAANANEYAKQVDYMYREMPMTNVTDTYNTTAADEFAKSILSDIISKFDNNIITVSNISHHYLELIGCPFRQSGNISKDVSTLTVTQISSATSLFRYANNSWVYDSNYIGNYLDLGISNLSSSDCTPESYNYIGWDMYIPVPRQPFKYVYYNSKFLKCSDVTTAGLYNALISSDSSIKYNINEEVLSATSYRQYEASAADINITRYSLELANFPYTALFTHVKQVENYTTYNLYNSKSVYYNYRIWFYGKELSNNIYYSNGDSIVVPIENCLTLSTDTEDYVTSLVPWRDYLLATTNKNIYLISKVNDGYVFKQINTFIGVPNKDANTCKAILNGIIFKSGEAVYVLHPNLYSNDETILNITDISKPISHHLINGDYDNFAIATETYYCVFIPREKDTLVFKYNYASKTWVKFEYPVKLLKTKVFDVNNILLFDSNNSYIFDKDLEWYNSKNNQNLINYGDYLNNNFEYTPIAFKLDTGQKSSNVSYTKQFTESKFILATLTYKDNFPIENIVYVDGINLIKDEIGLVKDMQIITNDVSSDGAFFKNNSEDIGFLNTNISNDNGEEFNTIRQKIIRYMGKGKTIRHILKGESSFNFKIYMLYYRYRLPHNKQ